LLVNSNEYRHNTSSVLSTNNKKSNNPKSAKKTVFKYLIFIDYIEDIRE